MKAAEAARWIVDTLAGGEALAEVIVVHSDSSDIAIGTRMLVWERRSAGSVGSGLDERVIETARQSLLARQAQRSTISTPSGHLSIYVEPHYPPDDLILVGAGHIARPLCQIGAILGFRVTVLDDRPGFATRERFPEADRLVQADFSEPLRDLVIGASTYLVLVTRGHKYDYDTLLELLRRDIRVAYVGMVGSRRRVRAAFEQLAREGIEPERLSEVYAPIGLDIGAETPEEIALAIAAELVKVRRGGTGTSLQQKARVVERWIGRKNHD